MYPCDLVVLRVRVVVPVLGASNLVAVRQHRNALRERQRGDEAPNDAEAPLDDRLVVGVTFDAPIAANVVVGAVAVVLAVRLVVLPLVAHEIVKRESIVRRDEVDAGVCATAA